VNVLRGLQAWLLPRYECAGCCRAASCASCGVTEILAGSDVTLGNITVELQYPCMCTVVWTVHLSTAPLSMHLLLLLQFDDPQHELSTGPPAAATCQRPALATAGGRAPLLPR